MDLVLVPVHIGVDTSLSPRNKGCQGSTVSEHDQKPACVLFALACIVIDKTLLNRA